MTSLQNYLNERPVITNKDAARIGVNRQLLSVLVKEGKLERLRPGVYQKAGEVIDDFMLVSANSNQVCFSHETALILHDLSDRMPDRLYITVPQGYNTSHIKKRYINLKTRYVERNHHKIGIITMKTYFGNKILVYDMERTICDIIADRENIEKEVFVDAITRYFRRKDKDIKKLIKYSRQFKIENEILRYIEILS